MKIGISLQCAFERNASLTRSTLHDIRRDSSVPSLVFSTARSGGLTALATLQGRPVMHDGGWMGSFYWMKHTLTNAQYQQ